MDPKNPKTLEGFVRSLERVAALIKERSPDVIVAPMMGAIPFIDVLNVVDPNFPNDKVVYVPASNKVHNVEEVMTGVFGNVISALTPDGGSYLAIDEVVSGGSAQNVFKRFGAARSAYARRKTLDLYGSTANFRDRQVGDHENSVRASIKYNTVGIVDAKAKKRSAYQEMVDRGTMIPVPTDCIVTMDKTDFLPFGYKTDHDDQGRLVHLPVVDCFSVSPAYVDFLISVAQVLGANAQDVTVRNMARIRDSYRWVPEELRSLPKKS